MKPLEPLSNPQGTETLTILVVDDDAPIRKMLERMLGSSGYSVLKAASGEEALGICEQSPAAIQLLITDLTMPGMNGLELADAVSERWPETKVLFISGYTSEYRVRRKLGEREFLEKPFTRDSLNSKIREMVAAGMHASSHG
jgi:CheY-like chemotaxis protein